MSADTAPAWLRELAAAAETMEIPPRLLPPATGGRASAVLVLFADGPGGPDLLLIQRSEGLRLHAGQPAFPGGAIDAGDCGTGRGRAAGGGRGSRPGPERGRRGRDACPRSFIPRTGFRVVPVLAWWRRPSAVAPVDAGEVAAVERVSVAELADPAARLMVRVPDGRMSPAFRVRGMLIWGFTAALVDRLLALAGWEKPWDATAVMDL